MDLGNKYMKNCSYLTRNQNMQIKITIADPIGNNKK